MSEISAKAAYKTIEDRTSKWMATARLTSFGVPDDVCTDLAELFVNAQKQAWHEGAIAAIDEARVIYRS